MENIPTDKNTVPATPLQTEVKGEKIENTKPANAGVDEEKVDFSKFALSIRKFWWVYLLFVVLCVGAGILYIKIKSPVYSINAMVMMNQNDEDDGNAMHNSALGAIMTSFSLGSTTVNIEDEIYRLTAHSMLKQVVTDLDLNTLYWSRDSYMVPKKSYFGNSPIQITMPETVLDTLSVGTNFEISIPQTCTPVHINVEQDGKKILSTNVNKMPCVVNTPYGTFSLAFTQYYKPGMAINLKASVVGYEVAIEKLKKDMAIYQSSRKANAIGLDIEDMDRERGKAILNHLIAVYNQKGIDDKNQQTLMSAKFIEDRLVKMYRELSNSEAEIESYKKRNNIVDAKAEADYAYKLKGATEEKSMEVEQKATILKMLREFMTNPDNKYSLVPFAEDLPELPIEKYNELVLEWMRLDEALINKDNAQFSALTAQVDAMRKNILNTLDKNIQGATVAVADLERQLRVTNDRMNSAPTFERELLELYRDQNIKNRIYGFLLQKREENELKLSKNVPKAVIIDEAYAQLKPIKPNKPMVLGGTLFAGLVLGWFFAMRMVNITQKRKAAKAKKLAEGNHSKKPKKSKKIDLKSLISGGKGKKSVDTPKA